MSEEPEQRKAIKAHCPKCGPARVAHVIAEHTEESGDEEVQWWDTFRIIQCAGCLAMHVQTLHSFSEDIDYDYAPDGSIRASRNVRIQYWPPLTKRPKPDWLPAVDQRDTALASILEETYQALDNSMPVAAAITMRTAFDRATTLLRIDSRLSFEAKLRKLVESGEIAHKEFDILKQLIEAGNAAAHRGWKPTPNELTTMILILEAFLHRAFVLKKEARGLGKRVPQRRKAEKKA